MPFDLSSIISYIDGVGEVHLDRQPRGAADAGVDREGRSGPAVVDREGRSGPAVVDPRGWLEQSWSDPAAFYAGLWQATLGAKLPQLKSCAFASYDLYGDTVARHRGDGHAALRWYDPDDGPQVLSYAALHARAVVLAGLWAGLGASPGATVCILAAPSAELLVGLAAALHLGLCISLLPPQGPAALQRRLLALAPDLIAADRGYLPLARALKVRLLPLRNPEGVGAPPPRSHTYGAKEPLLRLCSPMAAAADAVHTLSADGAVLPALRDGLLLLSLRPGDVVAAPGYALEQHLPALLLVILLCGATLLHLELRHLQARPHLLQLTPIRSLGISPALRDVLASAPAGLLRDVQRWFRDPAEPYARDPWQRLAARQGLSDLPGANLHFDDRAGGCLLFSPRRRELAHQEVLPAPGCALPLLDLSQSGQAALGKVSVFAGNILLLRAARGFLFGGGLSPRRAGRVYPAQEVCAAASGLPFVRGAVVVAVPGGDGDHRFVLLVFTGAAGVTSEARAQHGQAVLRCLLDALGEGPLPDHCEVYPLYPHRSAEPADGDAAAPDEAWCLSQHLRGMLHRKAQRPVFRLLTELRASAVPPPTRRAATLGPLPTY